MKTHTAAFSILALLWPLAAGQSPSQEASPSAEFVLDRYVAVTGGKQAYLKLHNILSRGRFEVAGSPSRGRFTAYEADPNRTRSILELDGGEKVEEGTIGETAWVLSSKDGARLKEGEERQVALREATFNSRVHWRKLFPKVELAGSETVLGAACHRVTLTPAHGKPLTHYYAIATGLLVRSVIPVDSPVGEVLTENDYGEYRESAGVLFPHRLAHRVGREEIVVSLDQVRCNVDIAWYRFDPPPQVKALAGKR